MAHFAEINSENEVVNILTIDNVDIVDENGNESEDVGRGVCASLNGEGTYIQTSYNSSIRERYAVIGGTYEPGADVFIDAQPYPSWVLNNSTHVWESPTPNPGGYDYWDEDNLSWVDTSGE